MTTLITPLPTPPTRQDSANFNDRADDFLGALPLFQQEANALAVDVQSSVDEVEIARQAVVSVVNVTKWVSGNTYLEGSSVWSPINGITYRKITSTAGGTTDPSLDSVNYKSITDAAGITYNPAGTGAVATTVQSNLRETVSVFNFMTEAQISALQSGTSTGDTEEIQAAINHIKSSFVYGTVVLPPARYGYKLTAGLQTYAGITIDLGGNFIDCSAVPTTSPAVTVGGTGGIPGVTDILKNGHLKGNANLIDGTYTANLTGLQINCPELTFTNITLTGFDKPTEWGGDTYNVEFRSCVSRFNKYGLYYSYPVSGNSGERILWLGGVIANNVHNVYNNLGNLWIVDASVDYPTTSHVQNNITDVGGVASGILIFNNCHIETTSARTPGTIITNNGRMAIRGGAFWYDVAAVNTIVNNGSLEFGGGIQWRILNGGGYYLCSEGGFCTDTGIAVYTNSVTPRLTLQNSGIRNSGFTTGDLTGWVITDGSNAAVVSGHSNRSEYSLSCSSTSQYVGTAVQSKKCGITPGFKQVRVCAFAKNDRASGSAFITTRTYTLSDELVASQYVEVPAATSAWTEYKIDATTPTSGGYFTVEFKVNGSTDTTTFAYFDDVYSYISR